MLASTCILVACLLLNGSEKTLSQEEIILNMAMFISDGIDTTAAALTGWTYFVCTHPNMYAGLVDEIRGTFAAEDEIRWEKVKQLRYLEATMNEALRLFPPSVAS